MNVFLFEAFNLLKVFKKIFLRIYVLLDWPQLQYKKFTFVLSNKQHCFFDFLSRQDKQYNYIQDFI
jgi:hypothetical protein